MTRFIALFLYVLASSQGQAQPATNTRLLAALTPVQLVMDAEVSSATAKPGERFPFHVAEDVTLDDAVLIPAGSTGEGEIVHAAKSKGGGRAGELILAARFVTVEGKQVRLRSFAAGSGKDRSGAAIGVSVAVGLFGMLVRGSELVMPAGAAVSAKIAEDVLLPVTAVKMGAADPKLVHSPTATEREWTNE